MTAALSGTAFEPTLRRWAADTWHSLDAMTDPVTGLPADNVDGALPRTCAGYTSPTNIGGLLWSTVVARDLGLISDTDCRLRLDRTLHTLGGLRRHPASGMFYNWYSEVTGERLEAMPDGSPIDPFLSSVDNGWLAVALMILERAEPASVASDLLRDMDFGIFYDADAVTGGAGGLLRGGFWDAPVDRDTVRGNYLDRGSEVSYTGHHYDTVNSEPRIASYLGIARGQIPAAHYAAMGRTGLREYRGIQLLPTWGGSMFEELMPDLFVPEAAWSPRFWNVNHRNAVRAQREFGMAEAQFGYWGFSPASKPGGGYSEWGVAAIALAPTGYPSDLERTPYVAGAGWGDGVITPHALFLALAYEPEAAIAALTAVEGTLGAYGPGGFFDAVAVRSGLIAKRYLSLDQSMILTALGNVLCDNNVRRYFSEGAVTDTLEPLLRHETFTVVPSTPRSAP